MLGTVAGIELIVAWFAWAYPFVVHAPHGQKRQSATDPASTIIGFTLQGAAVFIAWTVRAPALNHPGTARIVASMLLGPAAAALAWVAVGALGRQYRITAGVFEDHELVRAGPYRVVRHPIYASLLLILLSTLSLLTPWIWAAVSLVVFVAGTEIRIHAEERMLASFFGGDFQDYRKTVRAYIPFVR